MGTFNDGDSGSSIRTKLNTAIQKTEGTSAISTIDVDGGAIDGVTIGTNSAVTDLRVDNLKVDGNTISSTDTNGDVIIDPNGTGNVKLGNFEFDADQTVGSGQDNYVLTYDHSSTSISLEAASGGSSLSLYAENASSETTPTATGTNAVAVGNAAVSAGTDSVALGNSRAGGTDSFAAVINNNTSSFGATQSSSIAIGNNAKGTGVFGTSIGYNTVASAGNAVSVGRSASATGSQSAAFGYQPQASGERSTAFGDSAKAQLLGKLAFAGRQLGSSSVYAQQGLYILMAQTSDATATALTTNNSTAGTTNQIVLPNNSAHSFHGTIVAREQASSGTDCAGWEIKGLIRREGSASTATLIASTVSAIDNTPSWGMALSADTTNGCLKIQVTGAASTNIRWLATIHTSEVSY